MNANVVDQAVLIQHRGVYDNGYLFQCAQRFEGRFAVVGMVDVSDPGASDALDGLADQGAVGVRLAPTDRSPGDDPLAVWRKASRLGLVVSSLGNVEEFASDEFAALVRELPNLTIVVEHLAGVGTDAQPPYADFERAMRLAANPNVFLKVGGLGEISERPATLSPDFRFDHTPPLIEMARDAFGVQRMTWGSDYPPVSGREGYANALRGVMEHPAFAGGDDLAWVMGETARRVFRLSAE